MLYNEHFSLKASIGSALVVKVFITLYNCHLEIMKMITEHSDRRESLGYRNLYFGATD